MHHPGHNIDAARLPLVPCSVVPAVLQYTDCFGPVPPAARGDHEGRRSGMISQAIAAAGEVRNTGLDGKYAGANTSRRGVRGIEVPSESAHTVLQGTVPVGNQRPGGALAGHSQPWPERYQEKSLPHALGAAPP
jgi:hypothetical protein